MNLHFTLKELLLYQVALFSIFSPFAVIGPYSALTSDFSSAARNKIAVGIGFYTVLNLIVIALPPTISKGDSPRRKVKLDSVQQDEGWQSTVVTPLLSGHE